MQVAGAGRDGAAVMAQRTQNIDTLSMDIGLGTTAVVG
ncbi:hypothetical protein BN2497_3691 [Janthinobacterium sp. CG23_2]|nr:hypothetical protein BN2497_3691 [Janthinobacterium sp. CG23_2]CUU28243.1 hypothetical protein BN3177_3691 [Janthinobacterium sp. CG23_2]